MKRIRILGATAAVSLLAACSGGGGSSTPVAPFSDPATVPTAGPVTPAGVQMNPLTSYTVYVGSTDGVSVSAQLAPLSSGGPNGSGAYVGAPPASFLTNSTPQQPATVPGAVVAFPDGSTIVADSLGNFDASQAPWTAANVATLSAGSQAEVIVDATSIAANAAPLDTFVDVDEPAGGLVTASGSRTVFAATPSPVTLARIQVSPASDGMYDKSERTYFAVGFNAAGKKVALGKQKVVWTVANCSGAAAAGKLMATNEASKITYRAPASGSAGTCPDVLTGSYVNPSGAGATGTTVSATAKAFYHAHETAVTYSGIVLDVNGKPVAKGFVDFFATTASAAAGRLVAVTDKDGKFARKVPFGRTPAFLVANRVAAGNGYKYQFYNVTVSGAANATTGLTLKETTATTRPGSGI
ncbi:MAG: hypothetical protein NVS3B16_18440 [Vulcanimicrobiaceae bacterium]